MQITQIPLRVVVEDAASSLWGCHRLAGLGCVCDRKVDGGRELALEAEQRSSSSSIVVVCVGGARFAALAFAPDDGGGGEHGFLKGEEGFFGGF